MPKKKSNVALFRWSLIKLRRCVLALKDAALRKALWYVTMANCYLCGRPIEDTRYHLRRRVRTGDFERRQYSNRKVSTVQTHFGMRIVCTRCAFVLDRRANRLWLEGHVKVLGALIALLVALIAFQ